LKEIQLTLKLVTIDGAEHLMITPDNLDPSYERRLVIYAHGGAYTMGRPEDQIASAGMIAHQMRQRVLAIRYPLAWMEPFPAARDRLVAVYKEMLKSHSPQHIALSGDSAGGGLVLSSVLAIRDSGMPMPAALGLISPWADISKTGDSMTIQDGHDPLISYDNNLAVSALLYANGLSLTDPGVSPIYGDYTKGFPPTYISTGTRDLFLSHAARLQRKLTDAGVANSLYVYEGMWHVFQLAPEPAVPEVASAWRDYARFLDGHMAR
jgi:monoterpene epsilon-lactone hydrolase